MKNKLLLLFICVISASLLLFAGCEEFYGNGDQGQEQEDGGSTEYTVTFDTDGGSTVDSQKLKPDSKLGAYTTPSKAGYHFKAWYYGDEEWNVDTDTVKGDMTLKATWTPIEYTITYYGAQDSVNPNPTTYTIETETIILKDCVQNTSNCTFAYWNDQYGNPITEIDTSKLTNISISANWYTYTLTTEADIPNAGNHTPYVGEPIIAETSVTITAAPYKAYEFLGWYNGNEKLTDELSYTFDMPRDSVIYTAKYKLYDGMENLEFTADTTSCTVNSLKDNSVTELFIPECVTSVSPYALYECVNLAFITVDENNAVYRAIEGNLYSKDGKTLIKYARGKTEQSFEIPGYVTKIAEGAFYQCESLTSVIIPNGVTSIGDEAFYHCTGLMGITLPDTLLEIGLGAFQWCTGITSITIPDSVTRIPFAAFSSCQNLESVTIGMYLYEIATSAFEGCINLTTINYRGSYSYWNIIIKNSGWDYNTGSYTITYNYTGE